MVRMSLVSNPFRTTFESYQRIFALTLVFHMVNRESLLETRRWEIVLWNEKVEGKESFRRKRSHSEDASQVGL